LFVAPGIDGAAVEALHERLLGEGAVPRFIGPRLGVCKTADGKEIDVEVTFETAPSVVFDAAVIPGGAGVRALTQVGQALEFVKDQYRHAKTLLALGEGASLLEAAGIPGQLPGGDADPGVLKFADASKGAQAFIDAVARHRHWARQTDPPRV
jgi:catalase